jgi:hypothetical protein
MASWLGVSPESRIQAATASTHRLAAEAEAIADRVAASAKRESDSWRAQAPKR